MGAGCMKLKSDENIRIGENLRELRQKNGMTQVDVVRELQLRGHKVLKQNYSRYEKEQEHIPASVLVSLCDIFGTTLEDIFKAKEDG